MICKSFAAELRQDISMLDMDEMLISLLNKEEDTLFLPDLTENAAYQVEEYVEEFSADTGLRLKVRIHDVDNKSGLLCSNKNHKCVVVSLDQ